MKKTFLIGIMLLFVSGCSMGIHAEQKDGSSEVPILETFIQDPEKSVSDTADNQIEKAAEWDSYLESIAEIAEKSISVEFVTAHGENLSRTLYEYTTEDGNRFVFTDQKELRAFNVENWEESTPVDTPVLLKNEQEAVDAFNQQFWMVVPDLDQYEIAWSSEDQDRKLWEIMLEKSRGDYLRDRVLIKVREDGKVVSFVSYLPKAESYTKDDYTRDYEDAVARLTEMYPELDHCKLDSLNFDTYDDGICAAEYLIECTYISEVDGQKTETYSMEEMLYIVNP
nr:hypothetical protein [Clostridia bacterium]